MWSNVWAVIRREYLQRVRSKWFIISTVGGPVLMIAITVLPALFAARGAQAERNLAVVDATGVLYERVEPRLVEAGFTVAEEPWRSDAVAELTERANQGELGGFLVLDEATLSSGAAVLYATSRPSTLRRITMRSGIARAALEHQLEMLGLDADAMLGGGELVVEVLSDEGANTEDPQFLAAYVGAFFLYMVILLYAVAVMRATLEEKTSRVVEIVISSMKPWHLMLGKIFGVGGVGLTQMAVWLGSGVLIFTAGLPALVAARPELIDMEVIRAALPGLGLLMLFFGFFVLGFFMFAGLYAAVGAMCSTDEEAQQAQFPVIMLLIVPIIFVMPIIENPGSTLAVSLSLVPFFSPVLMWARVAGGGVPGWQVGLSFVLMALAVVAVAWVAGRIYRVGILMAGKRPTLPELWRWVKEA